MNVLGSGNVTRQVGTIHQPQHAVHKAARPTEL
jgi:hypothetical protein